MTRPAAPNAPIVSVPLSHPIQAYGETLTAVPIYRRITAGDIEWAQDSQHRGVGGLLQMLTRLSLLPLPSLRTIDAADIDALEEVVANFMTTGPTTGNGA